jgi:hypothetical protein
VIVKQDFHFNYWPSDDAFSGKSFMENKIIFSIFTVEDAFALFRLLHPRLDLVVVGHGQEATVRDPISPKVIMGKAQSWRPQLGTPSTQRS